MKKSRGSYWILRTPTEGVTVLGPTVLYSVQLGCTSLVTLVLVGRVTNLLTFKAAWIKIIPHTQS